MHDGSARCRIGPCGGERCDGIVGIAVHDLCRNGGVSWPMGDCCWLVGHGIAAGWAGVMVVVFLLSTLVLRRRFWARELVSMGRVGRRRRTQWIGLRRPDDLSCN